MTDEAWVRKDQYYQESGRYLVSAASVGGKWVFTAWRKPLRQLFPIPVLAVLAGIVPMALGWLGS